MDKVLAAFNQEGFIPTISPIENQSEGEEESDLEGFGEEEVEESRKKEALLLLQPQSQLLIPQIQFKRNTKPNLCQTLQLKVIFHRCQSLLLNIKILFCL